MKARIELRDVAKSFSDREGRPVPVLTGVSFSIDAGGVVMLEGRSGSGKSTILNLIAGLFRPDSGEIIIGDTRMHELGEARRDRFRAREIGYVFQMFNLLSPLSSLENLVVPLALAGGLDPDGRARARNILVSLGLADHLEKRPYELSVGQRQRVAVGRALLKRPAVLLADEPTANLDRESAAAVIDALRALVASGTTLVAATHDPVFGQAFDALRYNVETRGVV